MLGVFLAWGATNCGQAKEWLPALQLQGLHFQQTSVAHANPPMKRSKRHVVPQLGTVRQSPGAHRESIPCYLHRRRLAVGQYA